MPAEISLSVQKAEGQMLGAKQAVLAFLHSCIPALMHFTLMRVHALSPV
jgi:hypothetical protein